MWACGINWKVFSVVVQGSLLWMGFAPRFSILPLPGGPIVSDWLRASGLKREKDVRIRAEMFDVWLNWLAIMFPTVYSCELKRLSIISGRRMSVVSVQISAWISRHGMTWWWLLLGEKANLSCCVTHWIREQSEQMGKYIQIWWLIFLPLCSHFSALRSWNVPCFPGFICPISAGLLAKLIDFRRYFCSLSALVCSLRNRIINLLNLPRHWHGD